MRAHEFLFESTDPRSRIEKMRAVINDPATNENVRKVAQGRLDVLLASETPVQQKALRHTTRTNITEEDLEIPFVVGVKVGEIYNALAGLSPSPQEIHFFRQGQIKMVVPPPYHGLTREEYYHAINQACPGIRRISAHQLGSEGYLFTLSFV